MYSVYQDRILLALETAVVVRPKSLTTSVTRLNKSRYKHAHIVIACCVYCVYCLFFSSLYFCFRSCLLYIFVYYVLFLFSFDATILVNKDVYKG